MKRSCALVVLGVLVFASACSGESSPSADRPTSTGARPTTTAPTVSTTPVPTADPTTPPTTETGTTETTAKPWPDDADPSAGCDDPEELPPGDTGWSLDVGGAERSYRVVAGVGVDPTFPSPVIMLLHGLGSDAVTILRYSAFALAADRMGAVLVVPDATGTDRRWTQSDVGFLSAVLDDTEVFRCVDRNRIWLAGLSMGGFTSARLACALPGRFAAVGAVAGVGFDPGACGATPPVPMLAFHGTADAVIPYAGTPPSYVEVIPSRGAELDVGDWAAHNGCDPVAVQTEVDTEVTRHEWTNCAAETVLYSIVGGGHSWPGAAPMPQQGYTTAQISATTLLTEFFARNVRPGSD